MSDLLLETIQADVFALLQNTPALALANVLKNDAETTDSKIENAIKTLVTTGGKRGLAVVVMRAEVTEAEKNLPGPPLTIKIEIQVVEHVLFNQGADGTEVRSSQAALNVLSALHLRHFGNCLLYSEKNPIKPVQVKTGYVSDAVTLFAKFDGLVTDKPSMPTVSIAADMITLACATAESTIYYTTDGSFPTPAGTLYSAPFTAPSVGTVIRAAAYVDDMPPSDIMEFTITE